MYILQLDQKQIWFGLIFAYLLKNRLPRNWVKHIQSYISLCIQYSLFEHFPGVYIKFEIHIFAPPFWFKFFPKWSLISKFSAFFVQFFFFSKLGKNMHFFYQLGIKYAFSPLFSFPFNNFFSPTCYFAIFLSGGGGADRKIYTPDF